MIRALLAAPILLAALAPPAAAQPAAVDSARCAAVERIAGADSLARVAATLAADLAVEREDLRRALASFADALRPAADSAFIADPVLRSGRARVVTSARCAVLIERTLADDRRLVALNTGDDDAFLPLPHGAPAAIADPVFVSRDVTSAATGRRGVPSLVYRIEGDGTGAWGLRVPARATVVYRDAAPSDVRPRGLDE